MAKQSEADKAQQEEINSLEEEVNTLKENIETLHDDNTTLINNLDELAGTVGTLQKALNDIRAFIRVIHGSVQPPVQQQPQPTGQTTPPPQQTTGSTTQGLIACHATQACKGHKTQEHVDAHTRQVQRSQARQQQTG